MYRADFTKRTELRSVSSDDLLPALRQFASGVTVVTAEHDGRMYGITVSAFSSISLDPPVVMVSINNTSSIARSIVDAEHYAVHILAADQQWISEQFSSSVSGEEKYGGLEITRGSSGAPIFPGALAVLECTLFQTLAVGTHTLMFGRVVGVMAVEEPADPLIYYHRAYRTLQEPDEETSAETPSAETPGDHPSAKPSTMPSEPPLEPGEGPGPAD